jgi:hypothetical protein
MIMGLSTIETKHGQPRVTGCTPPISSPPELCVLTAFVVLGAARRTVYAIRIVIVRLVLVWLVLISARDLKQNNVAGGIDQSEYD